MLQRSLTIHGFPFFCGAVVGGYTFLQIPFRILLRWIAIHRHSKASLSLRSTSTIPPRFLAALCSAWFGLGLLNGTQPEVESAMEVAKFTNSEQCNHKMLERLNSQPRRLAGSSIDMTLFAAFRAAETVVHDIWLRRKKSRLAKGHWTYFEGLITNYADSWVFATSTGAIMWAWIYLPHRLPKAYNAWIKSAAEVDQRLIEVLRKARWGEFVYGEDTGQAPLLQSMCKEYGWPLIWGDPAQTVPLPCEMVHMGSGPSCHWHAVMRFFKAFKFALAMYLPLQLLLRIRHPSFSQLQKACREACRSSAFLGTFISLFYYGVCLSRTLVGPKLISRELVTPLMWDSGLCVRAGCILCGWSILLEAERRRQELAMFVVPRAAATIFPRRYDRKVSFPTCLLSGLMLMDLKHFWKERAAFSLSTATLFTLAHQSSDNVRGLLGGVLHGILA